MEFGAFFILVLVVIVAVALGGFVYLLAARRRRRQLRPEGGTLDARRPDGERERPEHLAVETEQRTRFIGTR